MSAWRWLPALLWAGLIFLLSSQPRLPMPLTFAGLDKLAHAGAYGVLALAVLYGLRWPGPATTWVPVLVVAVYGTLDEVHQAFVPGRTPDLADWIADVAGALLLAAGYWAVRRRRPPRRGAEGGA